MEIKISTSQILKVLNIISWILFIGLCVDAGSFIFSGFYNALINSQNTDYLRLSGLYRYDPGYYFVVLLQMTIVGVLKAIIFYLIVKLLNEKKLNPQKPFSKDVGRFMFHVSYLALGTGLFSFMGAKTNVWLAGKGVTMPDVAFLKLGGADVWLFMGVILYVVAQIFKRGIEIQTENDLTV